MKYILAVLALVLAIPTFATVPAAAQTEEVIIYGPHGVPQYMGWQPAWDRYEYDRHHVILGTVAGFAPYRLQIARRDGNIQMIDLKNGTVILPTGSTPQQNQRVAIVGYYSRGTFIANRVVLHY